MSLSPLLVASPEALALTGLVAMGVAGLVGKLWPRPAPIPAAIMAPPVMPALPAPPAVVAPPHQPAAPALPAIGPLLPPVVTYAMAITVFNNLFANAVGTALIPFVGHGINAVGQRIVGHRGRHVGTPFIATGWVQGAIAMLQRLCRSIIAHGNMTSAAVGFNQGNAAAFAESRMLNKIFQVLAPNNARLVNRGALATTTFHFCGFVIRGVGVPRRANHVTYPLIEYGNIRSDVSWTVFYFLIGKAFLLAHGATNAQADYIACCAMIEAVGVAYGQAPGVGWGVTPGDFGFVTPATLPHY